MPKGVFKRKARPAKREQILMTAREMYRQDGLVNTTIEQIAGEAGVSRSLISTHFGGKMKLIKAVAERALEEKLLAIREIDATPGLTLRQRETMIHDLMGQNLEDWRLILRTFLIPALQIRDQEELGLVNLRVILEHLDELREPTEAMTRAFSNCGAGLHMSYIIDGNEAFFQFAWAGCRKQYLRSQGGEAARAPKTRKS